jgi:hypothetical protein
MDRKSLPAHKAFRLPERAFLATLLIFAVVSVAAAEEGGLTVEEIVTLSKAELSDDVIINQILVTGSTFFLDVADLLKLKKDGVSDRIIAAMIETRLDKEPAQPPGARVVEMDKEEGKKYVLLTNKDEEGERIDDPPSTGITVVREPRTGEWVPEERDYDVTPAYGSDDQFEIRNIQSVTVESQERREPAYNDGTGTFPFAAGAVHGPYTVTEYFFLPASFSGRSHFGKFHFATYANQNAPAYYPVRTNPYTVSYVPYKP